MPDKCKRCNDKGYLHADGVCCPDCNGWGTGPYHPTDTVKCKTCDGVGRVGRPLRKGEPNPLLAEVDYDQITVYESCPDCPSCRQPVDDSPDHVPDAGQKVPPPEGYATWLDYAVATMDTRQPDIELVMNGIDIGPEPRSQMEATARAELAELRAKTEKYKQIAWIARESDKERDDA